MPGEGGLIDTIENVESVSQISIYNDHDHCEDDEPWNGIPQMLASIFPKSSSYQKVEPVIQSAG